MYGVKVLLKANAICFTLAAIFLLWNEEAVSCGYYTTKCLITMFIISAVLMAKEAATIKTGYEQEVWARVRRGSSQLWGNPIW